MRQDDSAREFLRIFRRHRLLILLVVIVAVAAGGAYSFLKTPVYVASTALAFNGEASDLNVLGAVVVPDVQPDKVAASKVNTVFEPEIMSQLIKRLKKEGIATTETQVRKDLKSHIDPESNLVILEASSSNPEVAQRLANTASEVTVNVTTRVVRRGFTEKAAALEGRLAELKQRQRGDDAAATFSAVNALEDQLAKLGTLSQIARPVEVVRQAPLPISASSPRPIRDTLLALFVGLVLGAGAAIARETLDRRVHSSEEIQELLDLPVIGYIRDGALGQQIAGSNGAGPMDERDVESFRILRANLGFLNVDDPPRSVIVTSALPEEGKSSVAASLAHASAAAGTKTLLLECDLRRPTLAGRLGLKLEPGLTDYLSRDLSHAEVLQTVEITARRNGGPEAVAVAHLTCITAGSRSPQPAETLGSERFKAFLAQAVLEYELVVLDTSPLLSVVDTRELVPLMDAVLLCTRVSRTTRDQMLAAKAALDHFPARPTAAVVTGMRPQDEPDYGYYSYSY